MPEWIVKAETLGELVDGLWTGGNQIVRCEDCKHRFESMKTFTKDTIWFEYYCKETGQFVNGEDFCAWGKRRTE